MCSASTPIPSAPIGLRPKLSVSAPVTCPRNASGARACSRAVVSALCAMPRQLEKVEHAPVPLLAHDRQRSANGERDEGRNEHSACHALHSEDLRYSHGSSCCYGAGEHSEACRMCGYSERSRAPPQNRLRLSSTCLPGMRVRVRPCVPEQPPDRR